MSPSKVSAVTVRVRVREMIEEQLEWGSCEKGSIRRQKKGLEQVWLEMG